MIFIAPENKRLQSLSIATPINLKHSRNLFIPPSNQGKSNEGVGKPTWKRTFAYLIGDITPPEPIEISTPKDSRFLFNMAVNDKPASGLVDCGCTTVIISSNFVRKHGIKTIPTPSPISLRFGNDSRGMADRQVTLTLTRNNYKRDLTFLVAPIKHDLILGTPWFESIRATNLDWHARILEFTDDHNKKHTWSKLARPSSTGYPHRRSRTPAAPH